MSVIVRIHPKKILEFMALEGIGKSVNAEVQKFCLPGFIEVAEKSHYIRFKCFQNLELLIRSELSKVWLYKGIIHLIETDEGCRC